MEKLSELSRSAHFKKVKVVDGRTGDLFVLRPPVGSREPGHTVIVVDHTVFGYGPHLPRRRLLGYGYVRKAIRRRGPAYVQVRHIEQRVVGHQSCERKPEPKNTDGPYNGHLIDGMYRAKEE